MTCASASLNADCQDTISCLPMVRLTEELASVVHPGLRRTHSAARVRPLVQASLDYKQRLQQLFFPEGIAFDGNRFNRTAVTAPLFKYLAPSETADERVVTLTFASWNQIGGWLRQIDGLRHAA